MKSAYPKKIVGHIYKSPLSGWYMRCTIAYSDGAAAIEYLTGEMVGKCNVVNGQTVLDYVGEKMPELKVVDGVYKNEASGVYMRCIRAHHDGSGDYIHMTGNHKGHHDHIPNSCELTFIGTTPRDNTLINKGGYVSGAREYMVAHDDELIDCTTLGGETYKAPVKRNVRFEDTELSIATTEDGDTFKFAGYQTIHRLRCDAIKGWVKYPLMVNVQMCHNNKDLFRVMDDIANNRDILQVTLNGAVSKEEAEAFKNKWNEARASVKLQPGMVFTPVDDVPEIFKDDPLYIQQYGRGSRIKKKCRINWVWAGIVTWCILSIITAGAFAFNVIMGIIK